MGVGGQLVSWRRGGEMVLNVSCLWTESAIWMGILRPGSLGHRFGAWLEGLCYRQAALVTGQTQAIVADIAARFPRGRNYQFSNGVNMRAVHPQRRTVADLGAPVATGGNPRVGRLSA